MINLLIPIFIASLAWNIGSILLKEGLYKVSPFVTMLLKSLVFFIISVLLLIYLFSTKSIDVKIPKLKKGLKFLFPAVLITYFIGTFSLLNLLSKSEKISVIIFLQSVLSLFSVAVLSYLFLDEKLTLNQIIGILIGILGTGIIIFNSNLYKKN